MSKASTWRHPMDLKKGVWNYNKYIIMPLQNIFIVLSIKKSRKKWKMTFPSIYSVYFVPTDTSMWGECFRLKCFLMMTEDMFGEQVRSNNQSLLHQQNKNYLQLGKALCHSIDIMKVYTLCKHIPSRVMCDAVSLIRALKNSCAND